MARKIAIKKKMWCFWNEDRKVEQVGGVSTNSTFELLLSNSTGDSTEVGGVKKAQGLTYNPSTKTLITSSLLNGLSINADKIEFSNTTQQTGSLTTTQLYFSDESNPGTVNSMTVKYNDIIKSSKWDGTNTSLYSALAGKVAKSGDTMTGNLTAPKFIGAFDISRVVKSCNSLPGQNKMILEEFTAGANYNLPSNAWYHIYTSEGQDTNYACQLALGMTTDGAYYRRYSGGSWGSWQALTNSGYLPLSGGTLSGDLKLQGSSNDTPDITWYYSDGKEKARIWFDNTYSSAIGPNYRVYNSSGTSLYSGRLATIGELNSDTGWKNMTWGQYRVRNGVCYIRVNEKSVSVHTWTTVGTIPAGSRPSGSAIWIPAIGGDHRQYCGSLRVNTDGNVAFYVHTAANYWASGSYPI